MESFFFDSTFVLSVKMGHLLLLASLLSVINGVSGAKWLGEVKKVDGIDYQCKWNGRKKYLHSKLT